MVILANGASKYGIAVVEDSSWKQKEKPIIKNGIIIHSELTLIQGKRYICK